MKSVVIYSSQTGNTEKIAFAIQGGIKQITGQCDIIRMKEANPKRLFEYDMIGIGAPTHDSKEPAWVDLFIKNLCYVKGKHCFAFTTHGTLPANFMPSIIPKLKEKGLEVIGYDDWYGSGNHAQNPGPWYTEGHPDNIDLDEAETFGRKMVECSVRVFRGDDSLLPEVPEMIDFGELAPERVFKDILKRHVRDFVKFKKEKCLYPACRLCMDNCPWGGIDITVDPPVLHRPCTYCGGLCEAICPTGAINWDDWRAAPPIAEVTPEGKGHIEELGIPTLREAEKQGRFRRLITEEEVKSYKVPVGYYNKHPRFIMGKGRQYEY